MTATVRRTQELLRRVGWDNVTTDGDLGPLTRLAVRNFQTGWAFSALVIDGQPGPATRAALEDCARRGGRLSLHFTFAELRCKCGGRYADCERIKGARGLGYALDRYRETVGPTRVVSGYRCPRHNRAVGGAPLSRHQQGDAVDVAAVQHHTRTARLGLFTGIGYQGRTGLTRHVDLRPGSTARPTLWRY